MKKYNFIDILTNDIAVEVSQKTGETISTMKFQKIEIPMIQRDYAHGRTNESEVRNKFLNSIFDSLVEGKEQNMDFIYGSVNEEEKEKAFIPLDGQQRLTTLFLLHWYIGSIELNDADWEIQKKNLNKFTYATRVSSRRFCEQLIQNIRLEPFDKDPINTITDKSWFYISYEKDPTVKSMLKMIEAIAEKYRNTSIKPLWDNLQKLQFYLLPLNGFNLTEELYVKMNARGKQLTDFENFKSGLINWMKDEKNPFCREFQNKTIFKGREMPYYLAFSEKIDTNWTNLFWKITKEFDVKEKDKNGNIIYPDGKIVDPLFIRFFYRNLLNIYILSSNDGDDKIEKTTLYAILNDEGKFQDFKIFRNLFEQNGIIEGIEHILDHLSLNFDSISNSIKSSWDEYYNILEAKPNQSQRVIYFAIMRYLDKFEYEEIAFKKWIRVVWNIVENTDINSVSTMISAIKVIEALSIGSDKIYEHLATNKPDVSSSKEAVKEEIEKAIFIHNDASWEDEFIQAEAHPFFKGSIGFIITSNMTKSEFMHRREMAFNVFDKNGVNDKYCENHIFLRAIISQFDKYDQILSKRFTDKDESEHFLKKMLISNDIVRQSTKKWFDLENEKILREALSSAIEFDSVMSAWNLDNTERIRKVHEELYKTPHLQNWMQQSASIKIHERNGYIYVSEHRSWYNWVMLDTYRNEMINELISNRGCKTNNQCKYNQNGNNILIPYFWGNDSIFVENRIDNTEIRYCFKNNNTLQMEYLEDEWKKMGEEYHYQIEIQNLTDIPPFLDKIEKDILEQIVLIN